MENWTNEFEHESITEENRESFNTAMSKYGSLEDAVVGGFNAQKVAGKPYKLPESLDKLPDDAVRGEFTSQAQKLLGIEYAGNIEDLTDLDLKVGMAEGGEVDENLANAFKDFVVKEKIPKTIAQKMIGYHNQTMAKATEAFATKAEADNLAAATATNEALIAEFGSKEKVAEQSELLRRAIQNHVGLTPEEYEEMGEAMADSVLTKNPVMAKVMLKVLAPLAAEGNTDIGKGGAPTKELTIKEELPKTGSALGWDK